MARPASTMGPRAARRRQQLVDAAFEVFAERGYAATSVSDITGRVGVSHGAFYRYFDSKRDILDEVIDDGLERLMAIAEPDEVPGDVTSAQEFLDRVREMAEAALDLVAAEPALVRIVVLEATSVDDELTHRLMGLMDLFAALAAPYFERAVAAGVLRPELDAGVLADAVVGMLMPGFVLAFRGELDATARERQVQAMAGLLERGVQ